MLCLQELLGLPLRPSKDKAASTSTKAEAPTEPAELSYETITSLLGQARTPQQPSPSAAPDIGYKIEPDARAPESTPAVATSEIRGREGSESSEDLGLDLPDVPRGPPVAPKAGLPSEASRAAAGRKRTASNRKLDRQLQQLLAEAEGPDAGESAPALLCSCCQLVPFSYVL